MAPAPAKPKPKGSGLRRKVGPFPLWVYLVVGLVLAVYLYRHRSSSSSSTASTSSASPTDSGTVTDTGGAGGPSGVSGSQGSTVTASPDYSATLEQLQQGQSDIASILAGLASSGSSQAAGTNVDTYGNATPDSSQGVGPGANGGYANPPPSSGGNSGPAATPSTHQTTVAKQPFGGVVSTRKLKNGATLTTYASGRQVEQLPGKSAYVVKA